MRVSAVRPSVAACASLPSCPACDTALMPNAVQQRCFLMIKYPTTVTSFFSSKVVAAATDAATAHTASSDKTSSAAGGVIAYGSPSPPGPVPQTLLRTALAFMSTWSVDRLLLASSPPPSPPFALASRDLGFHRVASLISMGLQSSALQHAQRCKQEIKSRKADGGWTYRQTEKHGPCDTHPTSYSALSLQTESSRSGFSHQRGLGEKTVQR